MRRAKAPRARQSGQAESTDVRGENEKTRCNIPSATAGRGGQNLALFFGGGGLVPRAVPTAFPFWVRFPAAPPMET